MTSKYMNHKLTEYIFRTQEEDRKRIASELHEGISQMLYSIYSGLQLVENKIQNDDVKNFTNEMIHMARRSIEDLRLLSTELYPHTLDQLGIYKTMKSYLKMYSETFGILVESDCSGNEKSLSELQNILLFRSCQEMILNSAKHADATQVNVFFTWEEKGLTVRIQDDGIGLNEEAVKEQSISGLTAVKEMLSIIEGDLQFTSKLGNGTQVIIKIPYLYETKEW